MQTNWNSQFVTGFPVKLVTLRNAHAINRSPPYNLTPHGGGTGFLGCNSILLASPTRDRASRFRSQKGSREKTIECNRSSICRSPFRFLSLENNSRNSNNNNFGESYRIWRYLKKEKILHSLRMFKNIFFVISVKICLSEFNITLRIEMYVYRKKVLILLENPRSQRIARTTHASMNVEKRGALVHLRRSGTA